MRSQARQPSNYELKATSVLALPLTEVSAKVSTLTADHTSWHPYTPASCQQPVTQQVQNVAWAQCRAAITDVCAGVGGLAKRRQRGPGSANLGGRAADHSGEPNISLRPSCVLHDRLMEETAEVYRP